MNPAYEKMFRCTHPRLFYHQPTVISPLPSAHCHQPTTTSHYHQPTTISPLPSAHCHQYKRHLLKFRPHPPHPSPPITQFISPLAACTQHYITIHIAPCRLHSALQHNSYGPSLSTTSVPSPYARISTCNYRTPKTGLSHAHTQQSITNLHPTLHPLTYASNEAITRHQPSVTPA